MAFVGSHLDVVPANPETWERNPFKLVVEVGTPLLLNGLFVNVSRVYSSCRESQSPCMMMCVMKAILMLVVCTHE